MRIVVLSPYQRGGYSGPAVLLRRLVEAIEKTVSITVVGPERTTGLMEPHRSVEISRADTRSRWGQVRWSASACLWIWQNRQEFDVAHLHGTYLFALMPALAIRLAGRPYILFPLSAGGDLSVASRGASALVITSVRRWLVSRALGAFALAPQMVDELEHWGLERSRTRIIGNAVPEAYWAVGTEKRMQRAAGRCLLFVGKLGSRKSPHLILSALHELQAHWPSARAVFVGPFENELYGEKFRLLVEQLGLIDSVTVTGHVDDVLAWIPDDASVFLLPSHQEGLPGALVEAMALGLPCGVSAVGAMGDVISEATGGEVVEANEASIEHFVRKLWGDSDLWETYSRSALSYASQKFSAYSVARKYAESISCWLKMK